MSSSLSDPGAPGPKRAAGRPPIWADGGQRPRFDARAYLRASLASTRAFTAPRLGRGGTGLQVLARRLAAGDYAAHAARLGRAARLVPSRWSAARGTIALSRLLVLAGGIARGPAPVDPLPFRGWDGAAILPEAPPAPAPAPVVVTEPDPPAVLHPVPAARQPAADVPAAERDTLETIRSLIHMSEVAPARPVSRRTAAAPPPEPMPEPPRPRGARALPALEPETPVPPGPVLRLAAHVTAAAALALAMPVGLTQALLAHLRGEDLRLRD